ncbi:glycosyl transferase [bacterium]|nr:glycosyl transferase [bacterium]
MSDFLWGAATSAHQVEGNNVHSDWWDWEKSTNGVTRSGVAADHYRHFAEDFALAKELGHNAHRLSLEWSRLEVEPGKWNERAISHYREVLLALREAGLTSFVTLHHFTNPQWFATQGGWLARSAPVRFARYAAMAADRFGDLVDFWVTINEPMVYATQSFWHKRWPPQLGSWSALRTALRHLASGHELAYQELHKQLPEAQVGIAKHVIAYVPSDNATWTGRQAAAWEDSWFNHRFFKQTPDSHDFIGVNYYFHQRPQSVSLIPPRLHTQAWQGAVSDMDWPIWPEGLAHALRGMSRYKKPLYVTENGLADAKDTRRPDFIRDHLRVIERAQADGIDVRGYLHWSLLDNFEWDHGFDPRFGLVEVDYATQKRTPRQSAYVYRAVIEQAGG